MNKIEAVIISAIVSYIVARFVAKDCLDKIDMYVADVTNSLRTSVEDVIDSLLKSK